VAKDCNDLNACTVDSCDISGTCQHVANDCNDLNACTDDDCETLTGCRHVAIDVAVVCNDDSLCTNDTCVPSQGCVHTNVTCNDGNPCSADNCTAFMGCTLGPVDCPSNDACRLGFCDLASNVGKGDVPRNVANPFCSFQDLSCYDSSLALGLGTAIGAGAIIGIVVGIALCVMATGGGVFAYYKRQDTGSVNSLTNNPLYRGDGRSGQNPLFRA
jgi:hypothetical protein